MAVRVTDADVEALVDVDSSIGLTPFIAAANELVTELCTDSGYTDARLTMIEAWLAAHFYMLRDQAVAQEKAQEALRGVLRGKRHPGRGQVPLGPTKGSSVCLGAATETSSGSSGRSSMSVRFRRLSPRCSSPADRRGSRGGMMQSIRKRGSPR